MNAFLPILRVEDLSLRLNGQPILDNIQLDILPGEQWAIIGPSSSGKTSLAHALIGRNFHTGKVSFQPANAKQPGPDILLIEQQHHFKNLSNTSTFYYQQRFNSMDAEDSETVDEYLKHAVDVAGVDMSELLDLLHIRPLLSKPLIQLSNGENKRLQLAIALLKQPALLILDNPFTGLDIEGRQTLHHIIDTIIGKGIHIILISGIQELPSSITHIAELRNGKLLYKGPRQEYHTKADSITPHKEVFDITQLKAVLPGRPADFETAIRMENVSVKYGDKTIIDNLNWEVKKGERWNVSGPNGAGKSTLLSLINGDNPQAYANNIWLFDRKRGSGESIWDIKKKIGYVSPELHLFFDRSNTGHDVVASGFFDTIGLFRQLSEQHEKQIATVMELLQLTPVRSKPIFQLSLGEQRMVLLARALVKNPPLLILDEPCQGLDDEQAAAVRELIDAICASGDTTLLYVSHYDKDTPGCVTKYLKLGSG